MRCSDFFVAMQNIFLNYLESFDKITRGELAEWSNAAVLKTVVPQGTGGSNPSLSARLCLAIFILFSISL